MTSSICMSLLVYLSPVAFVFNSREKKPQQTARYSFTIVKTVTPAVQLQASADNSVQEMTNILCVCVCVCLHLDKNTCAISVKC